MELNKIALLLYERNDNYHKAIQLAKKFRQYPEAIHIARRSASRELAEDLCEYFLQSLKSPDYFAATLQLCYGLLRPHVVMQMAWLSHSVHEVMPFMIRSVADLTERVEKLESVERSDRREKASPSIASREWTGHLTLTN